MCFSETLGALQGSSLGPRRFLARNRLRMFLESHLSPFFQKSFQPLLNAYSVGESTYSHHLHIDIHAAWQTQIRQGLDNLRIGIDDIDQSLVHSHLELLAAILINK